jgi:hypothetical protein
MTFEPQPEPEPEPVVQPGPFELGPKDVPVFATPAKRGSEAVPSINGPGGKWGWGSGWGSGSNVSQLTFVAFSNPYRIGRARVRSDGT